MSCRIIFGGISNSGKSTLVCSVFELLRQWDLDIARHELDVWSDTHECILGYKPWSERRKRGGPEGDHLHTEFAAEVGRFRTATQDIVLGDLPGRRNPSWETVAGSADGAIIVYRSPLSVDGKAFFADHEVDWERQMTEWGIPVIARVYSLRADESPDPDRICLSELDRHLAIDRPEITEIAGLITDHAFNRQPA